MATFFVKIQLALMLILKVTETETKMDTEATCQMVKKKQFMFVHNKWKHVIRFQQYKR